MPRFPAHLPPLFFLLALWACNDSNNTTPTTPTTPATFTDTFSGSINPNGAATHTFTTQATGNVTATLTSVGPDSSVAIGFSMGTWNGTTCQIVLARDSVTQGAVIVGNTTAGTLCVRLYDVGNLQASVTYEAQVVHP